MIFVGNLKSSQLRTFWRILQYTLMQNLGILGAMEGICFEFTSLNWFWKIWKNIKPCGARLSAPLSEQRHPDRTPGARMWPPPPPPFSTRGIRCCARRRPPPPAAIKGARGPNGALPFSFPCTAPLLLYSRSLPTHRHWATTGHLCVESLIRSSSGLISGMVESTTTSDSSPSADRIHQPAAMRWWKKGSSPVLAHGSKGQIGREILARLAWEPQRAEPNATVSLFNFYSI
jgi:hypothetical protein